MSDTDTGESTTETKKAPEAPKADGVETFSKDYVQQLRQEAAQHRTSKNDAVEAAKAETAASYDVQLAERDEIIADLKNQLGNAWIELEKYVTALEADIPSAKVLSFVKVLQGTDKESITDSVKTNLELFGPFETKSPAFDPSQGLGGKGNHMPLNGDPILAAIERIVGVR